MLSNTKNNGSLAIDLTNKHDEFTLSWSRVCIDVRGDKKFSCTKRLRHLNSGVQSQQRRVLLADVSGIVQPGQVLAVVGASGVGKTTLLKMLSGQDDPTTTIHVSGTVMLNGRVTSRNERLTSPCIGHVEQNQVFIETMTLNEHLIFQVMLQTPSLTLTDDDRRARVFETVKLLSLEQCASTTISKLSGGERKRLAFATVALIDPSIMLIDEPTSNLDSYLAKSLMQTIRTLAVERHRSIVIVLHQPTSEMFKFIDSLCVLVHGGRQAFFGDAHHEASLFFANDCSLVASSLDGFIEQLAAPETSASKEAMQSVERFVTSSYAISLTASTTPPTTASFTGSSLTSSLTSVPSFFRQMKWLLWRSFKAGARNPVHTHNVLIKTLVPAMILGLLYFNLPHRLPSRAYTNNVNGLLYLVIYVTATTCGSLVSGTMPKDILVFLKETQHRMYGTFAFYLSAYLHAFPMLILVPVIFCSILYWCASISVPGHKFLHFVTFVSTVVLTSGTSAALGEFIAATSSSVESAVGTTVPVLQILVCFSGYFVDLRRLPLALKIVQYLSPFYYGFSILTELQWNTGSKSASTIRFDIAMLFTLLILFNILAFAVIWYRAHRLSLAEKWQMITKDKS